MGEPEEVTEGHLDGGRGGAVPVAAEDPVPVLAQVGQDHGAVDVRDAACALVLEQGVGLTGADRHPVVVGAGAIERGGAPAPRPAIAEQRRERKRPDRMSSPIGAHGPGRTNGWLVA